MNVNKKVLTLAIAVGLSAMAVSTTSMAGWYWHRRVVHYRGFWGCKRVVVNRRCFMNRWGVRRCRVARRVRWVC